MKEYIKYFPTLNSANDYKIKDVPFVCGVEEVEQPIMTEEPAKKIQISGNTASLVDNTVTISGTWNTSLTNNYTRVIINGEVTLTGKTDCYSITFGNSGHLTINAGARLRIWQGGITNNDCTSVNYLAISEDTVNNQYGELILHPTLNISPKCTALFKTQSFRVASNNRYNQSYAIPFAILSADDISYADTSYSTAFFNFTNDTWQNIGYKYGTSEQAVVDVTKLIPFTHLQLLCRSTQQGTVINFVGNLSKGDATLTLINNYVNGLGNSYFGKIKTTSILQLVDGCILNLLNPSTKQWETQTESNITMDYIHPMCPMAITNQTGSQITAVLNYASVIWDDSFVIDEEESASLSVNAVRGGIANTEAVVPDNKISIFQQPDDEPQQMR